MHHLLKACAAAVLLLWSCNITADNRNGRWEVVTNSDHTVTLLCNGDTLLSRAASTARLDGRTVSSQSYRTCSRCRNYRMLLSDGWICSCQLP